MDKCDAYYSIGWAMVLIHGMGYVLLHKLDYGTTPWSGVMDHIAGKEGAAGQHSSICFLTAGAM